MLAQKPAHWLACYEGTWVNREGGPGTFRPQSLTDDNIREINAMTHIENELIDEACGRVLQRIAARGWDADTDVFFTTDHGELQGDFGLAFKGPFHTDALMRLPLVWRPAPSAGVKPADLSDPVGHVDLAPTFCAIAGIEAPDWMQGEALPTAPGSSHERVICEWDSQFPGYGMHMRSIYRDDYLCTAYEKSTKGEPNGLEPFLELMHMDPQSSVEYDGSEGELYNVVEDPYQFRNLWSDPDYRKLRDQLVADLRDNLPPAHEPRLLVERPRNCATESSSWAPHGGTGCDAGDRSMRPRRYVAISSTHPLSTTTSATRSGFSPSWRNSGGAGARSAARWRAGCRARPRARSGRSRSRRRSASSACAAAPTGLREGG